MKIICKILLIFIGFLCLMYSLACCMLLNYNLGNILPAFIGIFLIIITVFNEKIMSFTSSGWKKIIRYIFVDFLIIFCIGFFMMCAASFLASQSTPATNKDAIIVLGAGLSGDRVTGTLSLRLEKAIEYYNDNNGAIIVVSGGQGPGETVTEAFAMKKYLVERGISPDKVYMEDKSTSTRENFEFSKQILDELFKGRTYSIVYITNDFHILRAGFYAEMAGVNGEALAAESQIYMLPNYYTREYLAVLKYFIFEYPFIKK